ncbi:MAG: RDD family protein [Candidatus Kariarchaeaceae archaeon]|jgi:uncharacterized RDD family membrane protein YckC
MTVQEKVVQFYCQDCGASNVEGSEACIACGSKLDSGKVSRTKPEHENLESKEFNLPKGLKLAEDDARFWGFMIDVVIITILSSLFETAVWYYTGSREFFNDYQNVDGLIYDTGPFYVIAFIYYSISEIYLGRTIGKMLVNTKVVMVDTGKTPTTQQLSNVALNNFGKAFLFPLDVILGWIFTDRWKEDVGADLKQRYFQKFANMVVVQREQQ